MTTSAVKPRAGARWGGVAAWLIICSATACTVSGTAAGDQPVTTSTRPTRSTTTSAPVDRLPDGADAPDPNVDDVADPVFPDSGDPRIDVQHYDAVVRADPGLATIKGTATLRLRALTADPLGSFTLDLSGPAVTSATVDGAPAKVRPADDGEIEVTPAAALDPGVPAELVLAYRGTPKGSSFPGLGVAVGWQADDEGGWFTMSEPDGTSSWVPVSEHPSDKATWHITLDTPKDAVGISNGRLVSKAVQGDRRVWEWDTDEPMASYLVLAAVGHYDLVERAGPGGVRIALAFPTSLSQPDRVGFDELDDILAFYQETFGGLPDDDAGAIVVPKALGLALETQTRPLFGLDATGTGKVWALAHEVAHQWYGDAVSLRSWSDLWLNEGFATYADWLYLDHTGQASIATSAGGASGGPPRRGGLAVLDVRAAATFDRAIYQGGARALHALRLTIGDQEFFPLLRRWFADHDGANATTADFIALAETVSGRDLGLFFDAWLRSPDQPELPR